MKRFAFVIVALCAGAALRFTARGQQPVAAQSQASPAAQSQTGPAAKNLPEVRQPPLFFREPWRHPPGPAEHPITQESVSNPSLELKLYGDQPKPDPDYGGIWENLRDPPGDDPIHLYTGTCRTPCALALRDKDNFADLSGLARIKWRIHQSHFHFLHPIVKLSDGTWLIGAHGDGYTTEYHDVEFAIADVRWVRLDINRVLATGEDGGFVDHPDLSHVDEVGFADLVPGSGHGSAGGSAVATFEVWAVPVPRAVRP